MQYLLLLHVDESGWGRLSPEQQQQGMASYASYAEALQKAGAFKGSNRLEPSSAASNVRLENGKPRVTDGPFAETKEQVGGYFIIDVPDHATAVSWASRCPAAGHGVVEVRAIAPIPGRTV
jgi:hypothetical protein